MRLRQLDALRAVAILLVLGRHMEEWKKEDATGFLLYTLRGAAVLWKRCGWTGVDLFFVLSGFLVSGLLFSEYKKYGYIRLRRFFVRRGLKIYPAFYVFLVTTILVSVLVRPHYPDLDALKVNGKTIFFEAAFFQNYGPAIWNHTWSLAIEEHFYILIGLLILFLARKRKEKTFRPLVPIFIATATAMLIGRILSALFLYDKYSHETHTFPTHLRADSLFFGVLLAYFYHFHQERLARFIKTRFRWIVLASAILVSCCLVLDLGNPEKQRDSFLMSTFGFAALYLGFGGILMTSLYGKWKSPPVIGRWLTPVFDKSLSLLGAIGVYSYSIYLWHMAVKIWLVGDLHSRGILRRLNGGDMPFLAEFAIYAVGSILFGIGMAKLIEVPVLKLRDRLFPSRSAALPTNVSQKGA